MAGRPVAELDRTSATVERQVTLRVLERVREGAYADRAFAGEARRASLSGVGRRQANRLAYGVVQRQRTLDWIIDPHLSNPRRVEPAVRDILRIGTFEICFSDAVADAVAVDQAVRLVRSLSGDGRRRSARAGVVNAVLRRVAADGRTRFSALGDTTLADAAIRHSVPDWIARALSDALGTSDARAVLAASNEASERVIRWNPLRGSREEFEALLPVGHWTRAARIDDAYVLDVPFALEDSPVWTEGRGMAQSRASLLPVRALDPQPGERILDLCAAPGAKTSAIAGRMGGQGEVVAIEAHPARARALQKVADRLGADVTVIVGDGRTVEIPGTFDAVLVDPPCSGLGVLSGRPDARWRRSESDVPVLAALQGQLLARALRLVRPGGRVVYSTCTLLPQENEDVVRASGARISDLSTGLPEFAHPRLPGALRTLPGRDGTDGFFVARLVPAAAGHGR